MVEQNLKTLFFEFSNPMINFKPILEVNKNCMTNYILTMILKKYSDTKEMDHVSLQYNIWLYNSPQSHVNVFRHFFTYNFLYFLAIHDVVL